MSDTTRPSVSRAAQATCRGVPVDQVPQCDGIVPVYSSDPARCRLARCELAAGTHIHDGFDVLEWAARTGEHATPGRGPGFWLVAYPVAAPGGPTLFDEELVRDEATARARAADVSTHRGHAMVTNSSGLVATYVGGKEATS